MKQFLLSITFILFSLISFTSCEIENNTNVYPTSWPYVGYYQPYTTNANGQYVIGGYINGQQTRSLTRAATSATYGDNFSVFGIANGVNEDSLIMDNYNGVFSGSTWGYTEALKYFDNFVPSYSFLGIIPQDNYVYDATNYAVEISAHQFSVNDVLVDENYYDDQEILLANTQVAKDKYAEGASLQFKHINSKVGLYFTSNDPNTQIIDYSPYTSEVPYQPAVPGTQTTTTKTGKALDMLYAGEIVYWPYSSDSNLSASQANNFYKNTSNYGNMGSLMDAVNAQFVYYNTSGSVTTNAWVEGSAKKDMYGIQLASSTNKDDFIGGTTEDTWKDAFWTNASSQIKDLFRTSYAAGWRVIRIEHISGTQYDAWLLNNTEMTYKVITTTGGTPEVPYQPATGKEGIVWLPAVSSIGDGTDAELSTYPDNVTITANVKTDNYVINTVDTKNILSFVKPNGLISTTRIASPMTWFTFPYNDVANVGYTLKISYVYKGTNVYDARVWIPVSECQWEAGKYYKYIIELNGKGNGHDTPSDENAEDPKVQKNSEIRLSVSIIDYESGNEYTHVIQ